MGLESARERFTLERAAAIEAYRRQLNEAMADLFEAADFVMCSSNPDVAFAAEGPPPSTIPGADLIHEIGFARAIMNNAALTAPSNMNGSPAVSHPGRPGRRAARWDCRSWPPTTASSSCSTWPWWPSGTSPGPTVAPGSPL